MSRRLILQAVAIIALAGWRLANPSEASAAPSTLCGSYTCALDCSEGAYQCSDCPGYACTDTPTIFCSLSKTIYCFEEMR
jgi:hypothetical protein